ncbi:MAG TPA: response regulator, partial [Candidatus Limnocylindrales bacterium]|nr:response regulator [Candidatus Limnocylindrales bacterium]
MAERLFATAQILIVDDESANVRQLEQLLARAGYVNVRAARDPPTVLALFDALQPDLILLDLDMPHHDGLVLLGEIAARTPKDTYLPVLVLTGDATGTALRTALAAGVNDSLTKPFDAKEVLLRIRNLLETRFLHQSLQKRNQEVTEAAAEAVSGVMADLIARRDLSVVAERIASSVRTLLQAQAGGVYQIDPATDELVALAVAGEVPVVPQRRLPKGAGIGGRAVQTGRPAVSRDFLTDPLIDFSDEARALLHK